MIRTATSPASMARRPARRSASIRTHLACSAFAHRAVRTFGGAFDVTIAPVLVESGFLPDARQRNNAGRRQLSRSGLAAGQPRALAPQGMDRSWRHRQGLCGRLRYCGASFACGSDRGIVNAGGDLRCFGEPQPIHVRHPRVSDECDAAWIARRCGPCQFRGIFFRHRGRWSPDRSAGRPKATRCTSWDASVSVAAPDGMTADALTKVVRLAPDSCAGYSGSLRRTGDRDRSGRARGLRPAAAASGLQAMTKDVQPPPMRLSQGMSSGSTRSARWSSCRGWAGSWTIISSPDRTDFGDAHGPFEPLWLRLHGAAAMAGLDCPRLAPSGSYRPRLAGADEPSQRPLMLGLAVLLVVTGYGLYYARRRGDPPVDQHGSLALGIAAAAGLALHVRLGKRRRRLHLGASSKLTTVQSNLITAVAVDAKGRASPGEVTKSTMTR